MELYEMGMEMEFSGDEPEENKPAFNIQEKEILALSKELIKKAANDDVVRENARIVEQVCLGQKNSFDIQSTSYFSDRTARQISSMVILPNLVHTWASQMTKDRPSVMAVPNDESLEAASGAAIATKLIEFIEAENNIQDLWNQSAIDSAMHGTAFMKVVFDPISNRIVWKPLTVFDVLIHNAPTPEEVKWVVIKSYIDAYDAQALLKQVDPNADLPKETSYTTGAGIQAEGVEKQEIWYLPGTRYPTGLYACIINNTVVEATEYPYVFTDQETGEEKAMLPVAWWSPRKTRASTLGTSWTREATMNQVVINELYSKNLANARDAKQWLILPISLREKNLIDEYNARIYFDTASNDEASMIRWVAPAPVDGNIQKALNDNIEGIYRTAGINESTTGNAFASQSGKAISYQAALDFDKFASAWKSLESCQQYCYELTLRLLQKYYTIPRVFKMSGQDPIVFQSADINGVSLRLEPRSSRDGLASSKQEKAKQDIAAGFSGKEALLNGNSNPVVAGTQMLARQLIDGWISGEDVDINPTTMPPEIFVAELQKYINNAQLKQDFQAVNSLMELMKNFLMMIASQSGGGGPAPAPTQEDAPTPLPKTPEEEPGAPGIPNRPN